VPSRPTPASACAILIGGAGSRLGGDKHLKTIAGRPLAEWAVSAAASAGLEPVLVAKQGTPLGALGDPGPEQRTVPSVIREPDEPLHPLAGVLAAVEYTGRPIVVCPCDMPLVTPDLLARLASAPEPTIVSGPGGPEPLLGLYEPEQAAALRDAVSAGRSARATVAALDAALVEGPELAGLAGPAGPERMLANVNTPEDLTLIEAELRH
jgi:molybdopterin-guanine dinucleotide biosynthesis protein A